MSFSELSGLGSQLPKLSETRLCGTGAQQLCKEFFLIPVGAKTFAEESPDRAQLQKRGLSHQKLLLLLFP